MSDTSPNPSFLNRDGHCTDEGIAAYTEALLAEQLNRLPEALLTHVEACEDCRRQTIELYGLVATLPKEQWEEPEQQDSEHPSVPKRPHPAWRWSLVALTAILAFLIYRNAQQTPAPLPPTGKTPSNTPEQLLNPRQQPDRPVAETKTPENPVAERQENDLYAANFVPSDQLEGLAGEVFRSSGIEAQQPAINQVFKPKSTVRFQWKNEAQTPLQLVLLDNTGKELLRRELADAYFEWQSPQRPGLYYWKLESTEELLHTGKFFLK